MDRTIIMASSACLVVVTALACDPDDPPLHAGGGIWIGNGLAEPDVSGVNPAGGLWLSADHPAIGLGHGADYPLYEATLYGNVFRDPGAQHLCRGTDAGDGSKRSDDLEGRTCGGLSPESCGFNLWGDCSDRDRCITVNGHDTERAAGDDPRIGIRFHSISTFVALDGW